MRMDDMNAYFEANGFAVDRKYNSRGADGNGYYTFTISKGNHRYRASYAWPDNPMEFINRTIHAFEEKFGKDFNQSTLSATEQIYISSRPSFRDSVYNKLADQIMTDQMAMYAVSDVTNTWNMYDLLSSGGHKMNSKIKNVIFNDPATIVFWTDGTKTVVKAQDGDEFDPEKGLAMAISKKALGNKGNYCNVLKKWLPKEEEKEVPKFDIKLPDTSTFAEAAENMRKLAKALSSNRKESAVQKAYDILVNYRDLDSDFDLNEVIGLLGEALEG